MGSVEKGRESQFQAKPNCKYVVELLRSGDVFLERGTIHRVHQGISQPFVVSLALVCQRETPTKFSPFFSSTLPERFRCLVGGALRKSRSLPISSCVY